MAIPSKQADLVTGDAWDGTDSWGHEHLMFAWSFGAVLGRMDQEATRDYFLQRGASLEDYESFLDTGRRLSNAFYNNAEPR